MDDSIHGYYKGGSIYGESSVNSLLRFEVVVDEPGEAGLFVSV